MEDFCCGSALRGGCDGSRCFRYRWESRGITEEVRKAATGIRTRLAGVMGTPGSLIFLAVVGIVGDSFFFPWDYCR